jgi:hypothetical protein
MITARIKAGSSCRPTTTRPSSSRWMLLYNVGDASAA